MIFARASQVRAPEQARSELKRIRLGMLIEMGQSNLIPLFIIITTAATLHAHGVEDTQTSAQAEEVLRPIAGSLVFLVFGIGIIGTAMLAVPILAESAAYAVGEALGWHVGLARKPERAKEFYAVIAAAMAIGGLMNFLTTDPIKTFF